MTAQDLKNRLAEAAALSLLWNVIVGVATAPEAGQFLRWVEVFGFETARRSVERLSRKVVSLQGAMDAAYQRRYVTSVAKNIKDAAVQP